MSAHTVLPPSANWYCSKVSDSNAANFFVFGARHDVICFDCQNFPPRFRGVFLGHREKVTAVCLGTKDEALENCCSASEDGTVMLWNVATRELVSQHSIHSKKVTGMSWSSVQTDLIITGDDKGVIGVWQYSDDRQTSFVPEKGSVFCLVASPSTAAVAAIGYKSGLILLVDVKRGGNILLRLRGHDEEIHSLAWCPVPGEEFKPATLTGKQQDITDLETFGVEDSWRKKPTQSLEPEDGFGSEGWLLASGSKDRTIRIWSTSKGRQLLMLKLPHMGRRDRTDDIGKARMWLTLYWPQDSPTELLSSSQSGDLLVWDITKAGKEKNKLFHQAGRGHQRFVFNMCTMGTDSEVLVTTSMDRQILFWNLKLRVLIGILPSLGGYVYAAKTSPLDPGRLALGVGDNMIRIWNLNSPPDMFDITSLWQGIRGKVTALSWHPQKEGLLAYGTEDGRVGIYDVLSNKQPLISTTYHKRTVYVVAWGPPADVDVDQKGKGFVVYSVGDGNILVHDPKNLKEEAFVLSTMIYTANPQYNVRKVTRSEISWSPDYEVLAVGNDDGTVELFKYPAFLHVMTIQVHHKLINSIQWHPYVTMETPGGSPYKYWLATGSTESVISIVDVSKAFGDLSMSDSVLRVTESLKSLVGHTNRITNLAWSPHKDGALASVSYDGNAIVWDVPSSTPKACFQGHIGRLLCVQWSGLDPDIVITGGDDFSVHQWRVSENPVQEGQLDGKKKKKKKAKSDFVQVKPDGDSVSITTSIDSMAAEDQQEIEELLRLKKQELEGRNVDSEAVVQDEHDKTGSEKLENINSERKTPSEAGDAPSGRESYVPDASTSGDRKKRKPKSMFPVMGQMENRGKKFLLDDIVMLAKLIYDPETDSDGRPVPVVLDEDTAHLGLFLSRRAVYTCLNIEGQHHRNHENMEYYYQLEIWKGNINGVLRVARQREELSDWLVAMAPMASYDTWTQVCEDYALQLESDGQYHKAASYFLGCHKVYEAIKLFKRHKLFKEAIALAKVRLSPLDPALEELYTLWAHQLTKDGNYEQAAKCHLAMKQVQDAAKLLARRYDQSSLKTAAHISMIANDKQQGLMYTQKVVQQHLLQYEWKDAYSYLKEQKGLQVFMATSSIHEMLCTELTNLGLLDLDKTKFTNWSQEPTQKTMLPDFILDREDVDPMSPWQPHLIEGHTFPHHILRIWYSYLDVPMDTASLEDMYKTLCLLHAGRQTQVELQQIMIQVCTDLTLCMLSLMMSETPTAMSHLLQAVGSLHEAGHTDIMRGFLQLFLPQGPKYILKMQQEITAMRVMISMDTHSHVDGPSKVHTIKRYLSDLKEEGAVNTSSVRCRELDCLRAYYYMTILQFLKERCNTGEGNQETSLQESRKKEEKTKVRTDASNQGGSPFAGNTGMSVNGVEIKKTANGNLKSQEAVINKSSAESLTKAAEPAEKVTFDFESNDDESNCDTMKAETSSGNTTNASAGPAKNHAVDKDLNAEGDSVEKQSNSNSEKVNLVDHKNDKSLPKSDSINKIEDPFGTLLETPKPDVVRPKETIHSRVVSEINMNHFSITLTKLLHLSQGLLWDLQAKRYALTETLGYIHKAISQLLLSKKPKPSIAEDTIGAERSAVRHSADGTEIQTESGSSHREHSNDDKTDSVTRRANQNTATAEESSGASGEIGATGSSEGLDHHHEHEHHESHYLCPHHSHHGHICQTSLSLHFEHMINIHVPHTGDISVPEAETEPEFNSSFFEVCASCELLQKSRKILWEDEPHFHSRSDGGFKDMTNIINPAKYINVPDEWYNMPVDLKYFKPYVTMAILKDEQEYVMHELKRGPDSTQAPFPNPLESVKPLLEVCCHSSHMTKVDQQEFVQKVLTWAMNFAVTSQQKQTFVDLLQNQLES